MSLIEVLRLLDLVHPGAWVVGAALLSASVAGLATYAALLDLVEAAARESDRVRALSGALRAANDATTRQAAWREETVHDLTNAVAGLRAALHTLEAYDGSLDPATASELRRAAAAEVDHIEHLVTPDEHESTVDFELLPVVHDIVRIRRAAGQVVRLTGSAGVVRGRPGDVATVLQNLLVNAAAHAPGQPGHRHGRGRRRCRAAHGRGPRLRPRSRAHARGGRPRVRPRRPRRAQRRVRPRPLRRPLADAHAAAATWSCATASTARLSWSCCRPSSGGPPLCAPGHPRVPRGAA